jgi:ABC-type transport system involved in cytochrome c biogenesis permease subunit
MKIFSLKSPHKWVVSAILILCALLVLKDLRPTQYPGAWDLGTLAKMPVQEGGRIKPVDTIARTTLMMLSGKQSYRDDTGTQHTAMEWFTELILNPRQAAQRKVFRIDHPDLVGLLGFHNEERKYFSLTEIAPHFETLREQFTAVPQQAQLRDPFQKAVVKLQQGLELYDNTAYMVVPPPFFGNAVETYNMLDRILADLSSEENAETAANALELFRAQFERLEASSKIQPIPPAKDAASGDWKPLGTILLAGIESGQGDPLVRQWADLAAAFEGGDPVAFNAVLYNLQKTTAERVDSRATKTNFEAFFNSFAPFYVSMELYVILFIVAAFSWLGWRIPLAKTAYWILLLAFIVHTFGMIARIYIQARPPVTNLYSSAIFVSWAAIPLCLILERRALNGIAAAAAGVLGFVTLIIAHHLSFSGDTMEMMRAVLDSNFWLATHVPTVTLGYSATFLAGLIAAIYMIRGCFPGGNDPKLAKAASGMVYGSICFALLFSFVGTVLGGVWADQSWGRFWGWDPKENGALMIVLWNALILHARWAKVATTLGLMQLCIVGNIITAWSWFGTNMLGVGLHSYGFMNSAFIWLSVFVVSQIALVGLGSYLKSKYASE